METLWQDLRYGSRMLFKNPGFTAIAVITLALGIGANSSIFSLINAVLLRPLPFKDPDRLVMVWERRAASNDANLPISGHEFAGWRDEASSFESLAFIRPAGFNLTGAGDAAAVTASEVSVEFFTVLGTPPILGRTFLPGEDQGGGNNIAVVSEGLWKSRFASDREIVGSAISLNDRSYTVVGVMPSVDLIPDVLVPVNLPSEIQKVGRHGNQVIGRLKPGVTLAQAQSDVAQISGHLEQQYPKSNVGHAAQVISLHENTVGNVRPALVVLFGAVGFVLLIACANVANLLLSRAASRQKEIAIRTALGAARIRLIRQLLTESCLLAVMGGSIGLLLALWIIDLMPKVTAVNIPRIQQVHLDGSVLAVTIGLSLLTGIITGLAPALRSSRQTLNQSMGEGTRTSAGLGRRRIGSTLVVAEIALALVLLAGGGLMVRSFVRLVNVDPGFDPHNVLRVDLSLPGQRYSKPGQQKMFYEQLLERVKALPGVEDVSATTQTPLSPGDSWSMFSIEGRPEAPGQETNAAMRSVTVDYFRTLKVPLKKGRFFNEGDARIALPVMRWFDRQPYPEHYDDPQPVPAIIINETFARRFFGDEDPIGKRMRIIASPWLTIVGVVGDIKHFGLQMPASPEMYLSSLQEPSGSMAVMVRTSGDPLTLAAAVREQVIALDENLPVAITTMDQIRSDSVGSQRFNTLLLGTFAALALGLAVVGVYGVINYSVAQRTHELGVRIALGAKKKDIFKLVVGQGMVLALSGVAIGLAGALALTRVIAGLLFGVSPTDFVTFAAVSALLAGVALVASYIPARRAMNVDPMVALRCE
ncbi:MAG TPA: ABC transporter permease [Blastocatellia bacterium]|nr:ABC transporter permease [Blastocatellia bacterium]